ncbi:uncharacterized protein LOC123558181 [Mercenaria mercenaria]|uniref:uncharacterized protein LOC123558181 n=1 Tax=Mercenaria mercenaria TaxID=6596 RepID=UPI00234F1CF1|nr:uncharacterized protein LOC123558181 [Mercenaria mercenaria]
MSFPFVNKDLKSNTYNGPTYVADEVAACFPDSRDKIKIIDIACGTGFVGEKLAVYGFTNIDGLDPSAGMLSQCKDKGLYKNVYKEFCDVYDCLVVSGGMGEGQIPCSGIHEMIRIVKPDG